MITFLLYKFEDKTHQIDANRMFNLIIIQYLDEWPKLHCGENSEPLMTIVYIYICHTWGKCPLTEASNDAGLNI